MVLGVPAQFHMIWPLIVYLLLKVRRAAPAIKKVLPNAIVDGKTSRQIQRGSGVLAKYKNQGIRPRGLVYALGSNGVLYGDLLV